MSRDPRDIILARRARFVAAALAGVGVACGKEPAPPPQPCLSQPMEVDAQPMPCLVPPLPEDAGAPPAPDASAPTPDAAAPMPCLSPLPNPTSPTAKPRPCLSPPRPKQR